jgi:succinate-semialdehyde dehydrogenase/glutarate-semialdehyde dehydrogenase
VGELHGERREHLAAVIGREMGKPLDQALGEVDSCCEIYEFYADNAARLLAEEQVPLLSGSGTPIIRRSPFGALLSTSCGRSACGSRCTSRPR